MTHTRFAIGATVTALLVSMTSLAAGQAASTSAPAPRVGAAVAAAPLADAAEKADWTRVRALLTPRSDVNAAQVDGMTALHWATYHDQREVVELLLRAGAQARAASRYGVTPLSLACTNGNAVIVALLLKAGADPNAPLPGGETPLMTAARTGSLESVKSLLSSGALVDAKDERRGQTALMWAAAEGHAPVVEALIGAGADFRTRLPSGLTPLLFAVREGRLAVVRVLLAAGVDVNEIVPIGGRRQGYGGGLPPGGTSPLLLAVRNAHFELAAALLDAGADPNVDAPGYTVLHAITAVRKPGVGDNDPAPEGSGNMSSTELIKKLVAKGANVNARMTRRPNLNNTRANEVGATPFFLASLTADVEMMKLLASLGADPTLTNVEDSTPLMVAAGIWARSPGEDAGTEAEVLEAIQVLLDLGADLNAVDKNGETAMHGAAYKNLPNVVRFLAAKGAKIEVWNRPDKFEWTPLAIAVGYRFGNFKPSPVTEAAIREVMIAAGVTPPVEVVGKTQQIY
jgi:ankyrin repeat protein